MRQIFQTALTMLYPPRCIGCGGLVESDFGLCGSCWSEMPFIGGVVCDACGAPLPGKSDGHRVECDNCIKTPRPWQNGRAALLYQGKARKLVLALKHGDRMEFAKPAAQWMARAGKPLFQSDMIVAPIPLHRWRLMKRRFNQSALLAAEIAREADLRYCPDLLVRSRAPPSQEGRSSDERFTNLADAIVVGAKYSDMLIGQSVLIVDDVMTSGATLTAATEACQRTGAKQVCILTLARVARST